MKNAASLFFYIYLLLSGHLPEYQQELRLTFAGDIMAHNVNYLMKDYSLIYESTVDILQNDDLSFGNLEFPVDPTYPQTSYPVFNVHPPYVEAAVAAGFDVFSLANNHTCDRGTAGVLVTLKSMEDIQARREIYFSGIKGAADAEFTPTAIKIRGWKIGFIALAQFMNTPYDPNHVFMVDYNDETAVERFMAWLSKNTPDFDLFIVSYHGDNEYQRLPSPVKKAFFYRLLEAGVHIVYAHHPHVPQPYEIVGKDGLNRLILYSTGNFISGQGYIIDPAQPYDDWAYTGDSLLFSVKLKLTGQGPSVTQVDPIPIANYTTPRRDVIVELLKNMPTYDLPPVWKAFYQTRLEIMTRFIAENRIETQLLTK